MPDYNRRAEKRISELASKAAVDFETTIMHNRVYEQVDGQHDRDNELLQTLDLAERAYNLSDKTDNRSLDGAAFDAAESLNDVVDELVADQVARACVTIVQEADEWDDHYDQAAIDDAKAEAREWLGQHKDAAERVGVPEEVLQA